MSTHRLRSAVGAALVIAVVLGGSVASQDATSSAYAACKQPCNDPPPKPTATPHIVPTATPTPPPTRFRLVLQELDCYGVTDTWFDDEVYYRIGGTNGAGMSLAGYDSNGQAVDRRGPTLLQGADADNGTAWDTNPDPADQSKKFKVLYTDLENEPLAVGQTESMYLVLQESDGTDYGPYVKYGATAVAALIGGDTASTIAGLVGSAIGDHLINSDDNLGDFALQVQNTGPQLVIKSLSAGPYATITNQGPNWFSVHFSNDGGVYDAVFQIKGA
jgi:hypothetical protein